jgi:hypothetical protein
LGHELFVEEGIREFTFEGIMMKTTRLPLGTSWHSNLLAFSIFFGENVIRSL